MTVKKLAVDKKYKSKKKAIGRRRCPKRSLRTKYIDVETKLNMGVSGDEVSQIIQDLQVNKGWKNVQYVAGSKYEGNDLLSGHDILPRITGRRLQSVQEKREDDLKKQRHQEKKQRATIKREKEELGVLRRLAKKHGYKLVLKENNDESGTD